MKIKVYYVAYEEKEISIPDNLVEKYHSSTLDNEDEINDEITNYITNYCSKTIKGFDEMTDWEFLDKQGD